MCGFGGVEGAEGFGGVGEGDEGLEVDGCGGVEEVEADVCGEAVEFEVVVCRGSHDDEFGELVQGSKVAKRPVASGWGGGPRYVSPPSPFPVDITGKVPYPSKSTYLTMHHRRTTQLSTVIWTKHHPF